MDDKRLWLEIQKGDGSALRQLFDLYYKTLSIYIVQFTNNMEDAEDIAQSTFVKLWEKRNKINITTSLKSYLFRSAYNSYMDQIRKEKRKDLMIAELKYQALTATIDEDSSKEEERVNKIKEVVNDLPDKCKEILLLSKSEGLKYKEIAERLGISIKTVESQIRIAFQKIRKTFES